MLKTLNINILDLQPSQQLKIQQLQKLRRLQKLNLQGTKRKFAWIENNMFFTSKKIKITNN